MYGPAGAAPPPPPPRHPGPGAWGITVRLLFASFPLWSLGLLAWVPSLRFAVLRGRRLDWAVFGLSVLLTVVYVVLLIAVPADPEGESTASLLAGLYIVALITGAVVHAILGDRFPRSPWRTRYRAATAPYGYGYGYPQPSAPPTLHTPAPHAPPPQAPTPQPPSTAPPGSPVPPGSHRMRQVASELDELDELLRKRGNDR